MYQKVLLPLDGTGESEKIIDLIRKEMAQEAEVILLKILPYAKSQVIDGHVILGSQREEADRLESLSYLKSIANRQDEPERWKCEAFAASSSSDGILQAAQNENVDVIAMFTKERKGLAKLMKGNTARAVQRNAPVEVRVFNPKDLEDQPPQEALVGTVAMTEQVAQNGQSTNGNDRQGLETAAVDQPNITAKLLKDADLFRDLSIGQIDMVASKGERLSVAEGETLGKGGELGRTLFLIVEGEAQLSAHSQLGEISVRVVGPGDSFPMAALLGSRTLITSGEALTDMDVLAIPIDALIETCHADPEIGMHVYKLAAQLFADRYNSTLTHLATIAERELRDPERNWLAPH